MGATYLVQRGHSWYVQVAVPKALQPHLGKLIRRALGTRDAAVAARLKFKVLADIQREFAQAAAAANLPPLAPLDALLAFAKEERANIEAGTTSEDAAWLAVDAAAEAALEEAGKLHGRDSEGAPRMPPEDAAKVRRAYAAITGDLARSLGVKAEEFLEAEAEHLTASFVSAKRKWLTAFIGWYGEERPCESVTRADLGRYVTEVVQRRTKERGDKSARTSAPTRQKEVSTLRSFFTWLEATGAIEESPAHRIIAPARVSTRGREQARRPWTSEEVATVLDGILQDDPMWSLVAIGAYSGLRLEEVTSLRVEHIDGEMLRIVEGKTSAAVRRVPIHPSIRGVVSSLAKNSGDGYLLSGLLTQGDDGKRGKLLGKRFALTLRTLGVTDRRVVFHSLRNTVATQLEGAGVPVPTIQLLIGHARAGVTLSTYSAGVPDKVLADAVGHLTYGRRLDKLVSLSRPVITKQSAPRRGKVPRS